MDFLIRIIIDIARGIWKAQQKAARTKNGMNPAEQDLQRKLEEYVRGRQKPTAGPSPQTSGARSSVPALTPAHISGASAGAPATKPGAQRLAKTVPPSLPASILGTRTLAPARVAAIPAAITAVAAPAVLAQARAFPAYKPPSTTPSSGLTPRRGVGMGRGGRIKLNARALTRVVILSEIYRPPLALRQE